MEEQPKRTLAYLCPACHQSVVVERTVFQLAASANDLPCPCGKSSLHVEMMGDRVRLTVPCLSCGRDHTVTCSTNALGKRMDLVVLGGALGILQGIRNLSIGHLPHIRFAPL